MGRDDGPTTKELDFEAHIELTQIGPVSHPFIARTDGRQGMPPSTFRTRV